MIQIEIQNKDVNELIEKLRNKLGDLRKPMEQIGSFLQNITEESFDNERSPDGHTWHPLADSTKAYKAKYGGHKILQSKDSNLRESITCEADSDSVIVGVNAYSNKGVPYPIIHQFGTQNAGRNKDLEIKARPFLPIDDDEELYDNVKVEVLDILLGYLGE